MHLIEQNHQGLTAKQQQAIELIAIGKTDSEVGEALSVGRDTVNRWRNHNPAFIKALEAYQALLTIYTRVGNSEHAFQVFKLLKTYLPPKVFPLVINFLKLEDLFNRHSLSVSRKGFEENHNS